jgi:hypothetical protein
MVRLRATIIAVVLVAGQVTSGPLYAGDALKSSAFSSVPRSTVVDVALDEQGDLRGLVVSQEGQPIPTVPVSVTVGTDISATTVTDDRGAFRFRLGRGGIYQLQAAGGAGFYRVWSRQAAPPSAKPNVLLVASSQTVRGQGHLYSWISEHPWCFYSILATAIVVPVVVVSAKDDSSS